MSGATPAEMGGEGRISLSVNSGTVRFGRGGIFLSCDLWALDFLQENTSVLICVLSVRGVHPCAGHCVKGRVGGMNNGMEEEDQ